MAGLFLTANTSLAGSSIYILVAGNLFSLCFLLVAAISVENALDKAVSTSRFSTARTMAGRIGARN